MPGRHKMISYAGLLQIRLSSLLKEFLCKFVLIQRNLMNHNQLHKYVSYTDKFGKSLGHISAVRNLKKLLISSLIKTEMIFTLATLI